MRLAKVCILGEVSVGKTSLIRRFVDRSFSDTYLTTVGVKISRKQVTVPSDAGTTPMAMQLVLWDLEGGERFDVMTAGYLRGALGAVIVGDLQRPETIEAVARHRERFLTVNPAASTVIALNKSDLVPDGHVPLMLRPANSRPPLATIHTSALTGDGVDEIFSILAAGILREPAHDHPA